MQVKPLPSAASEQRVAGGNAIGRKWLEQGATEDVDRLLIHEFGHQYSADHLSEEYHEALCHLGARLKRLALEKPEALRQFTR